MTTTTDPIPEVPLLRTAPEIADWLLTEDRDQPSCAAVFEALCGRYGQSEALHIWSAGIHEAAARTGEATR